MEDIPVPGSALPRGRLPAAAAAMVSVTIAVYLALIVSQGEEEVARVAFVLLLLVLALACIVGTMRFRDRGNRGMAGFAATGMLLSMGFLALFSVGLLLMIAGLLMIAWIVRTHGQRRGDRWALDLLAFVVAALLPWTLLPLS